MLARLRSAGLLPYRLVDGPELLIAHPGGPYFARRDNGWWSIVKGIVEADESDLETAAREFEEETGWPAPPGPWLDLGETVLKSRKTVSAYAVEAELDPEKLVPGLVVIAGRPFPEIDRVAWMRPEQARVKLNPAQGVFIDRLLSHLSARGNNVGYSVLDQEQRPTGAVD
jgi:predicted NUDIX family NTP pyrophosphohydrolase